MEANETTNKLELQRNHYDSSGVSLYYNQDRKNPQNPSLTIPRLRKGSVNDLAVSKNTFAYVNESGCHLRGLKEFIRTKVGDRQVPVYIIDNHNHALFAWCEALNEGNITKGAVLLHIDNHGDEDLAPKYPKDINNLSEMKDYTPRTKIYNFIAPALKGGIISKVIWINPVNSSSYYMVIEGDSRHIPRTFAGMDNPKIQYLLDGKIDRKKLIVDVDLDYFTPSFEDAEFMLRARGVQWNMETLVQHDLAKIRQATRNAGVVTLSTSPEFID